MAPDQLPAPMDAESPQLGCWLKVPSTVTAEAVSLLGFDYISIDMQHGLVSRHDLIPMLQAIHPHSPRTIVRVPANDPSTIGWCLDGGATGVIVPLVNSAAEAEAAVEACLYPPAGQRSTGPTRSSLIYGRSYVDNANSFVQCIPMIETVGALESLDAILSIPGIDAIYVGPSDLSRNLGLGPGNHDGEPAFDDALVTIVEACRRSGVVPGIHADAQLALKRLDQGFRMVTIAEDLGGMKDTLVSALDSIRNR